MNIQKALSFIAFGFLFTLLNININSINITPSFIGWILLFLSYDPLGKYTEGKIWLKWIALVLTVLTFAIWILGLTSPDFSTRVLDAVASVTSAVYMYFLLGILENVANDYGSGLSRKLHTVKYVNLVAVCLLELVAIQVSSMGTPDTTISVIVVALLFLTLILAIYMMFLLFRLRRDIKELA
ncbi:MAG: hypothetical protein Q4D24_03275 [Erysipelotrichaceae bacterium]|nr:hypothetical protein [Erysipelotrichaceae bacterium]